MGEEPGICSEQVERLAELSVKVLAGRENVSVPEVGPAFTPEIDINQQLQDLGSSSEGP